MSPQAAACGLNRGPLETALQKQLTDAGFRVLRNSDEDTYLYINVITTTVPSGLCFKRQAPANATDPAGTQPPFAGRWAILSWTPVDNWFAAANPVEGSNLVNWAKGALQTFQEGA